MAMYGVMALLCLIGLEMNAQQKKEGATNTDNREFLQIQQRELTQKLTESWTNELTPKLTMEWNQRLTDRLTAKWNGVLTERLSERIERQLTDQLTAKWDAIIAEESMY